MRRTLWPRAAAIAIAAVALNLLVPAIARAELRSKTIPYQDGELSLEGYLAWDDAYAGRRPGILVVHEWWGLNEYARRRADMLARLGYLAFAVDMYGKGKTTQHPEEARAWATEVRKNVDAWRRRGQKGLEILRSQELVDPERVAAIGYCFGGSTVLQLAFVNAPLRGVVSFHGALPEHDGKTKIRPRILVCHGADDNFIPEDVIAKFRKGLDAVGADWQMVSYGGARHSFTNPDADKSGVEGLRYHAKADQRSWKLLQSFLQEIFEERVLEGGKSAEK
jgi:dienelactone hydrolase